MTPHFGITQTIADYKYLKCQHLTTNKMKPKYQLHIVSDCGKRETYTSGDTVQECIDKLNGYHTFGKYEQDFFTKKGEQKLKEEMESGWYINI